MIQAVGQSVETFYNKSCCCAPLRYLCDKIRAIAESVFGYILRIITFQLGEMKVRGAYTIMRIYQRLSSDPREEKPIDLNRLADSKKILTQFGGVETTLTPADGQAKIRCMTFKSADFFEEFRRLGSEPIDIVLDGRPRRALLDPPAAAAKFYLETIKIRMPDGALKKGALLPESPPGNQPRPLIIQCHSPGRSMSMDRKFIGLHLAAGYDVIVWDPRGTIDSTGTPSEGGYYLDGEAVFQYARHQGYQPNRIYVSGFCEGAAIAAHLKNKYHHLGVHFIAGNPYTSMKDVVEGYGRLGRIAAHYGLKALQSTDPNITGLVKQDNFDNVAKLANLPRSEGKVVILDTDPDKFMPRGTAQKLCRAFDHAGPFFQIPTVYDDPNQCKHTKPPYEDPGTWRDYVQKVT